MRRQARQSSISPSIDWMEHAKLRLLPHAQPPQTPFLWHPLCFHSPHPCGPRLANCQMAADRCPVRLLQLLPSFTVRAPPPYSSWGIDEGEGLGPQGLKGVDCGVGTGLHAKCSVSF